MLEVLSWKSYVEKMRHRKKLNELKQNLKNQV